MASRCHPVPISSHSTLAIDCALATARVLEIQRNVMMKPFTAQAFQRNPSDFRRAIHKQLRKATFELQDRGLKQSAAWASDLLLTISSGGAAFGGDGGGENAPDPSSMSPNGGRSEQYKEAGLEPTGVSQQQSKSDLYLLAKSYFDLAEYKRSAYVLREILSPSTDPLGYFLRLYSTYLAGEKRKEAEMMETKDPLERCQVVNKELKDICAELEGFYPDKVLLADGGPFAVEHGDDSIGQHSPGHDGYILHLYGVVLKKCGNKEKARIALCRSCTLKPFNWSAWLDLASISTGRYSASPLPLLVSS